MKKNIAILIAVSVATLTACGSKTDANEKNFAAAMTQYFDKKGDLCLDFKGPWPVDLDESDLRLQKTEQTGIANKMAALEAVGLAKSEDIEVEQRSIIPGGSTYKSKIRRYTLTDAAKPFVREKEVSSTFFTGNKVTVKQTDLCWGKQALDRIVKWEGPMKFGDYQEAGITYTYKVNNIADWAKKPEVQSAFPDVKSVLDGAGSEESKHGIKLTSQGWEARGLD
jgi:hypothetical protein